MMTPYKEIYEKFMIYMFQQSLKDVALTWFVDLKVEDMPTWDDLANLFMRQDKFNIDGTLIHLEL